MRIPRKDKDRGSIPLGSTKSRSCDETVDVGVSNAPVRKDVGVRIPPGAPIKPSKHTWRCTGFVTRRTWFDSEWGHHLGY